MHTSDGLGKRNVHAKNQVNRSRSLAALVRYTDEMPNAQPKTEISHRLGN